MTVMDITNDSDRVNGKGEIGDRIQPGWRFASIGVRVIVADIGGCA